MIKEYTTNFHSDGILAHSGTSVTNVTSSLRTVPLFPCICLSVCLSITYMFITQKESRKKFKVGYHSL